MSQRLNKRAAVAVAALLVSACGLADGGISSDDDLGDANQAIQGGVRDTGHPAVGLVWFQGGGFCTGTLVAPDVVLTAGHCVVDPIDGFYTGSGIATTQVGVTPPSNMTKHAVRAQVSHPSYVGGSCPNTTFDIGLIRLAAPITGTNPLRYAKTAAPAAGVSCTAVGFGTHNVGASQQYESKRKGTEVMQVAAETYLQVGIGTGLADHGDSGGPLLCNNVIAGTTSCHVDGDWPQHTTEYYARVDTASAWIAQQISAWHSAP